MFFETQTLQAVYWVALAAGLGILVLSLLLGDVFDFLSIDLEVGGTDLAVFPVFAAAVAAFGAGGLIGIDAFGLGEGGSIIAGLGTGAAGGFLTGLLFSVLHRQEAPPAFNLTDLIGSRGLCALTIAPGTVGRVTVTYEGMTRSYTASSTEEIATGEEVVIKDVVGSRLTVARPK